jgi:hypothetical protein
MDKKIPLDTPVVKFYRNYKIEAHPKEMNNGRFSVVTKISRVVNGRKKVQIFKADDKIWYILEIEASKESINLGINLINKNLVGF